MRKRLSRAIDYVLLAATILPLTLWLIKNLGFTGAGEALRQIAVWLREQQEAFGQSRGKERFTVVDGGK